MSKKLGKEKRPVWISNWPLFFSDFESGEISSRIEED
jgi:hypothetical protein